MGDRGPIARLRAVFNTEAATAVSNCSNRIWPSGTFIPCRQRAHVGQHRTGTAECRDVLAGPSVLRDHRRIDAPLSATASRRMAV